MESARFELACLPVKQDALPIELTTPIGEKKEQNKKKAAGKRQISSPDESGVARIA